MHKDTFVFLKKHKENAQKIVAIFFENNVSNNYEGIICISGISGCGKSETAWWCSRMLYKLGISSHTINLDRYYKTPAISRNEERKKTGIIGHEEMDFDRINEEVKRFINNDIKVLIFEGLYANYIKGGINFLLSGDIDSTYEFRKMRNKENEDDKWRKFVVEEENKDIIKGLKDYYSI